MNPKTVERLRVIRRWVWNQKYRFQLGQQWLAFVNMALLLITLSKVLGFRAGPVLLVAIPAGFVGMWAWGWFLDVVVRQGQSDEKEALKRSPAWQVHLETNRLVHTIYSILSGGNMVNQIMLLGRMGKDPELRYTASGSAVAGFSVATTEKWKDDAGNKQERTTWHDVVAWRKLAELCAEYGYKGQLVFVQGKIQKRDYEGKDGVKRYVTEVVADHVQFLSWKNDEPKQEAPVQSSAPAPAPGQPAADDLPF